MPLAAAVGPRSIAGRLPRNRRTWTLLSLLAVLFGSVLAFANITEDYLTKDPLVDWDVRFASWLHAHSTEWLVTVFKVVTWAGNSAFLIVVVGALAVLFVRRGRVNDAAVLVAALGGAGVINALLKLVFQRPRPELAYVHLETYSFPSGHAAVATATFTTLAFVLGRRSGGRRRIAIAAAAIALIALVGFSRLYLGVHYLSDVLAGWSFGLAWASLCLIAYTLYGDRRIRLPHLNARASARPRP
ncbi:MAG TPA: phosphatase PAP2 family protein [Gaiellaceae bacterium]|jgi:membrane-associated phospholipid phosphatase|nr:phosphatase PAP2 family protein [Gaiellaceae bacterium]